MANSTSFNNHLMCVHYPGVVKNEARVVETLGGLGHISTVFGEKHRRLEIKMRPEDCFCKPAYASRRNVAAVVLKVRVKKKRQEVVSTEVLGYATEEFWFNGLCDFQFIPTNAKESVYEKVTPTSLDWNWLSQDAPFFLPPPAFSRYDSVQNFSFLKGATAGGEEPAVIGRISRKRYGCTRVIAFDNKEVPTSPKEVPTSGTCTAKLITADMLDTLKKLFEERPVYSKQAIVHVSHLSAIQLKAMLPCVAYYFTNGPWRALWVRFGYDPRSLPEARIYQTLDYRVRSGVSKQEVKSKRSSTIAAQQSRKPNTPVIGKSTSSPEKTSEKREENMSHVFKAGIVPSARQCFYQYCDIEVPEIQALLEAAPKREECHETHGWFPQYLAHECRHIMNNLVAEELRKRGRVLVTHPADTEPAEGSDNESDYESVLNYLE